jgi:hypothetical protein
MGINVVVTETTASGKETARMLVEDVPSPITLRDLIRHRVREEVVRLGAKLDWQTQAEVALDSFQRNGFFVFVNDRQVTELDEELTLAEAGEVSFVRLVALAGG